MPQGVGGEVGHCLAEPDRVCGYGQFAAVPGHKQDPRRISGSALALHDLADEIGEIDLLEVERQLPGVGS